MRYLVVCFILTVHSPAWASELTDAILGVEPTPRYTSGQGSFYDRVYGPDSSQSPDTLPENSNFLFQDTYRSPLFNEVETAESSFESAEPAPLYDTDVPLLDEIPGSDYELLDSQINDTYDF